MNVDFFFAELLSFSFLFNLYWNGMNISVNDDIIIHKHCLSIIHRGPIVSCFIFRWLNRDNMKKLHIERSTEYVKWALFKRSILKYETSFEWLNCKILPWEELIGSKIQWHTNYKYYVFLPLIILRISFCSFQ
jgi:hypothetical protein